VAALPPGISESDQKAAPSGLSCVHGPCAGVAQTGVVQKAPRGASAGASAGDFCRVRSCRRKGALASRPTAARSLEMHRAVQPLETPGESERKRCGRAGGRAGRRAGGQGCLLTLGESELATLTVSVMMSQCAPMEWCSQLHLPSVPQMLAAPPWCAPVPANAPAQSAFDVQAPPPW
jgi:hypothetical protein